MKKSIDEVSVKGIYKIKEVAQYLGVTERYIYSEIRNGNLRAKSIGPIYIITETDFNKYLYENNILVVS
ncbi:MAG: helix-turn-helix domain-containing protein [Bacillota bacterium]|nr:helix-turn-helix domain-containing protein [Bacillota bacterium]